MLRRRWRLIALSAFLFLVLGSLLALLLPPTYTAVAEVAIGRPSARPANMENLIGELILTPDTIRG